MTEYRSVSGSVAEDLFIELYDDLLKQNSMIYLGWDVYRWAMRQMQQQPEAVKDELRLFLGGPPPRSLRKSRGICWCRVVRPLRLPIWS